MMDSSNFFNHTRTDGLIQSAMPKSFSRFRSLSLFLRDVDISLFLSHFRTVFSLSHFHVDANLDEFHQNKRTLLIRGNLIRNLPAHRSAELGFACLTEFVPIPCRQIFGNQPPAQLDESLGPLLSSKFDLHTFPVQHYVLALILANLRPVSLTEKTFQLFRKLKKLKLHFY